MAAALVLDTSVLVKWFKSDDEELMDEALALRDRVDDLRAELYAPTLLLYELGNILTRKTDLPDTAIASILDLARAGLVITPGDPALLHRASTVARTHGITFYDASFVAVAAALNCPFVTADRQLADRTRGLGLVHHLATAADLP
jgi:predicted nucleic acid-binding protein